jgi:hypothetical protein
MVDICRAAVGCSECFKDGSRLRRGFIDVAQPRFIGTGYWTSAQRILVLMINPGKGRDDEDHRLGAVRIREFGSGQDVLAEIFQRQRDGLHKWGKFMSFCSGSLGLKVDGLALANVAWCSTNGNDYPPWMLNECFNRHTERLVRLLSPDEILLGGSDLRRFRERLKQAAPSARVILTPHYAHRKSREYERQEAQRIQSELGELGIPPANIRGASEVADANVTPGSATASRRTVVLDPVQLPDDSILLTKTDLEDIRKTCAPYGIGLARFSTHRQSGSAYAFTHDGDGQMIFCLDWVWKKRPKRWIRFSKKFTAALQERGLVVSVERGGGHNCAVLEEDLASALDVCAAVYLPPPSAK